MAPKIHETATAYTTTLSTLADDLRRVDALYTVRNALEVARFLTEHPELTPIVLEAPAHTAPFFPGAPLALELVTFHDEGDQQLFIFVQTNLGPDVALERLEELDSAWQWDASVKAEGHLVTDVEFV